jgi:zinc protease
MNTRNLSAVIGVALLLTGTLTAQNWAPKFEKFTLKNGLDVILHRDTTLPLISVSIAYRAGSSADKPGKTGIAQIAGEHLMLGTRKVPREKLLEFRSKYNAMIQAQTGVDWVNLSTTMPMNYLEAAIMIEADRLESIDDAVTNESVAAAIKRLREEHAARARKALGALNPKIFQELYDERHPYRHVTIGDADDLDSIGLSDVRAFVRRNYQPGNASLTIGGNFELSAARNYVEKYFGKIQGNRGAQKWKADAVFAPIGQGGFILEDNIRYNQLMLVFPTAPAGHPDESALRLLAQVLAGSNEAVLRRNLPKQNPNIVSVEASQSSQELTGTFWLTITCKMEAPLQPVYDDVMRIVEALAGSGVPEDDLLSARNHLSMTFFTPMETFYGFGGRCDLLNLGNLMSGSPLFSFNQFHAALAAGSPSLQRAAGTYLTRNNQLVISILPAGKSGQAVKLD